MMSDIVTNHLRTKVVRSFERKFGQSILPYNVKWASIDGGEMIIEIKDRESLASARYKVCARRIRCIEITEASA